MNVRASCSKEPTTHNHWRNASDQQPSLQELPSPLGNSGEVKMGAIDLRSQMRDLPVERSPDARQKCFWLGISFRLSMLVIFGRLYDPGSLIQQGFRLHTAQAEALRPQTTTASFCSPSGRATGSITTWEAEVGGSTPGLCLGNDIHTASTPNIV